MKKVSIIVPCYNQAAYLDSCLQSVINQSYNDWECIVINDGSTDNTEQVANAWCAKDSRFGYMYQVNSGVSKARNTAIQASKGIYILPLDADDKIHSNYVQWIVDAFDKNINLTLVYGNAVFFENKKGNWDLPNYNLSRLAQSNIIYNTAAYKKKDWEVHKGYDESMIKGLEDWDFWIRLLQHNGEVYKIPEVCFYYRIRRNSRNHSISSESYHDIFEYLNKKHMDFFITHLGTHTALVKKNTRLMKENESLRISKKNAFRILKNALNPFYKTKLK